MTPQAAAAFVVIVVAALAMFFIGQSGGLFDQAGVDVSASDSVVRFANAINFAEHGNNSIPNNNPGDLVPPGWTGPTFNSEGVAVFSTLQEGWQRLYHQLNLIVSGQSHVYSLDMTIAQMAAKWTRTDVSAWASNVAYFLNTQYGLSVTVDTPLSQVIA